MQLSQLWYPPPVGKSNPIRIPPTSDRVTIPLFAYGTLRSRDIRIALFGTEVEWCDAELPGHKLLSKDGFFTIASEENARVPGVVLFLSASQLTIADLWEEVPLYTRKACPVCLRGRESLAWVYCRPVDLAHPARPDTICDAPWAQVLEMAHSLGAEVRRSKQIHLLQPPIIARKTQDNGR
jgi:hypothetical protein